MLQVNQDVTSRRFHGIFYARLKIFRIFLKYANSRPSGIRDEHKSRWLLLQIDLFVSTSVDKTHAPDPALLRQIAGCVLDYIFHGNPRDIGSPEDARLVEYRVARFGGPKKIITDEPLALLAVADYSTKQTKWTLPYFLKEGPSNSDPSARGIASDYFGAYALALAFRSPTHLGNVFDFVGGNNDLENETGYLVAVHKQEECYIAQPFVSASLQAFSTVGPP